MPLSEALRARLVTARRERDLTLVSALRTTIAALDNAGAVPPQDTGQQGSQHIAGAAVGVGASETPRQDLTLEAQRRIVTAEIAQLHEQAAMLRASGSAPQADSVERSADILRAVLQDVGSE